MVQGAILWEREGPVGFVILNRPERRNALNAEMLRVLPDVVKELEREEGLRTVIFRGVGDKAFSAGGDITEFKEYSRSRESAGGWHELLVGAIESVYRMEIPTIAMVHGPAIGAGCEIAMACDIRVAADDARFGITGSRLGFPIPYRNAVRLVSLVGPANAKKLLYTGELVSAQEALRMGLVGLLVDKSALEARTLALAKEIADNAPLAQRSIKRTINQVVEDPALTSVEDRARWFVEAFLSRDLQEGVDAFLEKRPPRFKGE